MKLAKLSLSIFADIVLGGGFAMAVSVSVVYPVVYFGKKALEPGVPKITFGGLTFFEKLAKQRELRQMAEAELGRAPNPEM